MGSLDSSLAQWLALREAADFASRSRRLTEQLASLLKTSSPVNVLDLGTGTGSNLRYLVGQLPAVQHWTVVDRDASLLAHMQERTRQWAAVRGLDVTREDSGFAIRGTHLECLVEPEQRDLGGLESSLFNARHLVTASALLDLVSESWLDTLAAECARVHACALFTITYDGRSPCAPADPDDDIVRELFNRHQRTDKGLGGPAAGPDAVRLAPRAFERAGYRVARERSDWVLEPDAQELQRQLIEGWASAAMEMAPEIATQIANWRLRRLHHVTTRDSLLVVGHEDMLAWPA